MFNKIAILIALSTWFFVYIHSYGSFGRNLGSQCFLHSECGKHSKCMHGYCACDEDHIPDKDNIGCVTEILKPCKSVDNDKCFDIYAKCINNTCICDEGYALNEQKLFCAIAIGFNCSKSNECIEGSCIPATDCLEKPCNYTQCACNSPLKPTVNGSKCLPDVGKDCSAFNKCARENSFCDDKDKICKCEKNFKPAVRNNETFCLLMLNNTCSSNSSCADDGAICKPLDIPVNFNLKNYFGPPPQNYCICSPEYIQPPNTTVCLKVATEVHDNCTHNLQCQKFAGSGSLCTDKGKCDCKPEFYFDEDMNRCLRSCVCNDEARSEEIVKILKDLSPMLDTLAKKNNLSIPRLLRRIKNL